MLERVAVWPESYATCYLNMPSRRERPGISIFSARTHSCRWTEAVQFLNGLITKRHENARANSWMLAGISKCSGPADSGVRVFVSTTIRQASSLSSFLIDTGSSDTNAC